MSEETKPVIPDPPQEQIKKGASDFWAGLTKFFTQLINLEEGLDRENTIINIRNNKRMRGANAWMLMCSIVIASIGLDLNSEAVIIGAMLISPLMSPILGIGLSIGVNDKNALLIALQHFGIAIAIALITSTVYFYLSPFGEITEQIEKRTAPTLLDVLVAFFGGLAGIISGSRKDISNAIPGVAIATALMPPLCVTGFGIANWNVAYLVNSFYLFFLNATFVAVATFIIVRYLKFPVKAFATVKERRNTLVLLWGFSLILIIPSAFILTGVLGEISTENNLNRFIDDNFSNTLCEAELNPVTDTFEIKVLKKVTEQEEQKYNQLLAEQYGVKRAKIKFIQTDMKQVDPEKMEESIKTEIFQQLEAKQKLEEESGKEKAVLERKLDSLQQMQLLAQHVKDELQALYPEISDIHLHWGNINPDSSIQPELPILTLAWKSDRLRKEEKRIRAFLKKRTALDTFIIAH